MAAAHHRERRFGRAEHAHIVLRAARRRPARRAKLSVACLSLAGDDEAREPAERRIVRALAQRDLAGVERLAVAARSAPASPDARADASAESRCRGLPRGRRGRPPDAASWNVRSAARGSPLPRPRSASTMPTRLSLGKWWPFGDQLRADDDIEAALRDVVEFLAQALDRCRRDRSTAPACARRETARPPPAPAARRRGRRRRSFRSPGISGTRPAAAWRSRNDGRRAGAEAVIDQPGVAVRAVRGGSRRRGTASAAHSRGG